MKDGSIEKVGDFFSEGGAKVFSHFIHVETEFIPACASGEVSLILMRRIHVGFERALERSADVMGSVLLLKWCKGVGEGVWREKGNVV